MADLNNVVLIGRLTRDAILKYTGGGTAVSNFSIAVNKSRKQGSDWVNETSYFDISLFGKQAESLSPYLKKGKMIAVNGELKQDRWEQEGQNRSKILVVAHNIQLISNGENRKPDYEEQGQPLNDDFSADDIAF